MSCECLKKLTAISNKYGSDAEFVLAGGGNTSYKNENTLYIKGSGTALATIKPEEFVRMDRAKLAGMLNTDYPSNEKEREAAVLSDMMNARCEGETRRPSVETLLHDLFPQRYVLHVHPAAVNGLTCSVNGKTLAAEFFPNSVWVESTKPGYILACACRKVMDEYANDKGHYPSVLILGNHGIFFAAETTEELDVLVDGVMNVINAKIENLRPDFTPIEFDTDRAASLAPALRMIYGEGSPAIVKFSCSKAVLDFDPHTKSFTPDHIVYSKARYLILPEGAAADELKKLFDEFTAANSFKPKIVYATGLGVFSCGMNLKEALTAEVVFNDAVKIYYYARAFGGCLCMTDELINFIVNWEVESYRSKVSLSGGDKKRLAGKIAVVTGAAQGFGRGIAEHMASEGAYVVVADMNYEGAKAASDEIPGSIPVLVNVTDEDSVKAMSRAVTLYYGGIDILVNNAGVVKAGSLEEMTKKNFEFVTSVNYTGYFLCVKYCTEPMKIQHSFAPGYMMDVIEINSKSGLAGSNKNFAYAGSKFGGIGLTQSFALELVEFNIKVNAICPGNFLNGPLWSDPEKGLFVQYLKAGKVLGAKTVDDVRRAYESKVPLGRGCEILDVVRAIYYIVEQEYETGQAIPVTGGQEMLK